MNMEKLKFGKADYPQGSILFDVRYYYKPECFEVVYFNPITNQLEVEYEEAIIDIDVVNAEIVEIKGKIAGVEEQMDKYLKELGLKWGEYFRRHN